MLDSLDLNPGILLLLIFAGILMGGFINIYVSQIPKDDEDIIWIWPRCSNCSNNIPFLFMFVPFLWKCKCSKRISKRYHVVIVSTIFAYITLFAKYGLSADFFALCFLMTVLIPMFFIDLEHFIIPDELVILGLVGGVIVILANFRYDFEIYGGRSWTNPVIGGVSISVLLFLIAVIGYFVYGKDAMGMGDVKIFSPIGIFLGWKVAIVAFFLSAFAGSIYNVFQIIRSKKKMKDQIPFGPYIVIGTFLASIFGWDIINWYVGNFIHF